MSGTKKICSIIVLSYNQADYTKKCLESIRKYTSYPYEIIVIDNASNEETILYLEKQKDIILVKNTENKGFAGGCNQGVELAKGEYIMLLNNDTIVTKNWLTNMVELMETDKEIAMVGPLTNSTVGKQKIEVPYGENMEAMQEFAEKLSISNAKPWKTLRLVGFCVLIRKRLIEEIGMLDTDFKIGNYEDDDFCIRALLEQKSLYICRTSFIHHFMNISFVKNNMPREEIMLANKSLLENKWRGMNWNHHAVTNDWLIKKTIAQEGMNILHMGCGLGTLGIELKDRNPEYYITGIEDHPIRKEIAKMFLDELYEWDSKLEFLKQLKDKQFDTIIVECMLEKTGLELLELIKPFLKQNGQVLLRIFNISHITTLERLVTGTVGGNLLCASSDEFNYYFDKNVERAIVNDYSYDILDEVEIKKSLTIKQENMIVAMKEYSDYVEEGRIYNRLYQLMK